MLIKYVPYSEIEVTNTAKSATATVGAEILGFHEDRHFSLFRCLNSSRVSHTLSIHAIEITLMFWRVTIEFSFQLRSIFSEAINYLFVFLRKILNLSFYGIISFG
jgi:hypothetical protein